MAKINPQDVATEITNTLNDLLLEKNLLRVVHAFRAMYGVEIDKLITAINHCIEFPDYPGEAHHLATDDDGFHGFAARESIEIVAAIRALGAPKEHRLEAIHAATDPRP